MINGNYIIKRGQNHERTRYTFDKTTISIGRSNIIIDLIRIFIGSNLCLI